MTVMSKVTLREYQQEYQRRYRQINRLKFIWYGMRQRCSNPKNPAYKYYGGRGIKVCDNWKNSYAHFEQWALQNGYRHNLQIDRIDNNGNYEPQNCRFVTCKEQARNRRDSVRNVNITFQGKTQCLSAWAREFGMSSQVLKQRLRRLRATTLPKIASNWTVEKALTTPVCRRVKPSNITMPASEGMPA